MRPATFTAALAPACLAPGVARDAGLAGLRLPLSGPGGMLGFKVVPGGPPGDPTSPDCVTQRPTRLTDDDPFVRMGGSASRLRPESSLALVPAP